MRRKHRFLSSLLAIFASLAILTGSLTGLVAAQDAKPTADPAQLANDPTLPQETPVETTPEPTETPVASTRPTAQKIDPALTPGAPATLAHGLAFYDGDDLVWQVQELTVPSISRAESVVAESAIIVQRKGQSIIRNDESGKRALLTQGEAFFTTADDSYTLMAEDDTSTVWKFTLVDPDDVATNAFYESPSITAVREGSYDFRIVRYVLRPGETADLPANSGAGLVMPSSGDVQVDHGGQLSILGMDGTHGQGQMLRQPTSISNTGSEPVSVFYLYLGESVSDASAGEPRRSTNTSSTSSTGSSDTNANSQPGEPGGGTTTNPGDQQQGGPYLAQINIYAETDLWLSVTVDGVLWFDGKLPTGSWTGPMNGTTFEVYTSSGANTLFLNACGVEFYMGQEPGDAWYTLTATRDSCPPPR